MPKAAIKISLFCYALFSIASVTHAATNTPAAIPWNQIGAKAGADYKGDGLTVTPTATGAQLHCVFQRLDGEATPEGLWLTSTAPNTAPDRFRVTAIAIGRAETPERGSATPRSNQSHDPAPIFSNRDEDIPTSLSPSWVWPPPLSEALASTGQVTINNQTVRFTRPGLTEEYTTTMDGLRQDFIVTAPPDPREASWSAPVPWRFSNSALPTPHSALILTLSITGARVEPAPDGARLVLANSGRKIAYTRLRVTDATGKELQAHIEVPPVAAEVTRRTNTTSVGDEVTSLKSSNLFDDTFANISPLGISSPDTQPPIPNPESRLSNLLSIIIDDSSAQYPLRIDPTFSDANWISLNVLATTNNISGTNGSVIALAVSGTNLYVGGNFSMVGGVPALNIAEWNGTGWSALGLGISGQILSGKDYGAVFALAVSGTNLYVGGQFTNAGGVSANNIAQWDGNNWSALSSGMDNDVGALAVMGSTLFAGGDFAKAGSISTPGIAQWNGKVWSVVGSGGADGQVYALAVSGNNLYMGGSFPNVGGVAATNIALWNGTNWSALGPGIGYSSLDEPFNYVDALAVQGTNLYAGGIFTNVALISANNIAQWNGNSWSSLGLGFQGSNGNSHVDTLAVSGTNLYAGGIFTSAGGSSITNLAFWNGSAWFPLGSGVNNEVDALAVAGTSLYVGGTFTTAGNHPATNLAEALEVNLPVITISPAVTNAQFVGLFSATPGLAFTVQFTPGLSPADWQKLTNVVTPALDTGLGSGVINVFDSSPNMTNRYYRAVYPAY